MKHTIRLCTCGLLISIALTGCSTQKTVQPTEVQKNEPTVEELAIAAELELATERDVIKSLDFFDTYHYDGLVAKKTIGVRFSPVEFVAITTADFPIDKKCLLDEFIATQDNSDECIIARRDPRLKESIINHFNYQKYLPENSIIKSELEFVKLDYIYGLVKKLQSGRVPANSYWFKEKYSLRKCDTLPELTTAERTTCDNEQLDFIRDWVAGNAQKCTSKYPKEYAQLKREQAKPLPFGATYEVDAYAELICEQAHRVDHLYGVHQEQLMLFGALNLCVPE